MPKHVQTQRIPVTLAERPHPFPSRTRKLSSPAPKILRGQPFGKIGRRRDFCVSGAESASGLSRAGVQVARHGGRYPVRMTQVADANPPADRPSTPPTSRHLSLPPRRERLAQRLAREGASLPGGWQRRAALRREAEAVVPDCGAQDVSRVCHRARPRKIGWPAERTVGTPPRRPYPRMAPVVLDHGRIGFAVPAAARDRPAGQLALGALMVVAFAAIAFARLSGVGAGGLAAGVGSPSPQATLAAALPTPTPSPVPTAVRALRVAGPDARPEPDPARADLQGQARRDAQCGLPRGSGRPSASLSISTTSRTRRASPSAPCSAPAGALAAASDPRARARATRFLFAVDQSGRSALAATAVRGDEATGLDLGDAGAAAGTRLAALVVDGEEVADLLLERGRDPCPEHLDRVCQGRSRRFVQGVDLLVGQRRTLAERQEAGRMEDLVGIGVTDAGDKLLVAEQVLQLAVVPPNPLTARLPESVPRRRRPDPASRPGRARPGPPRRAPGRPCPSGSGRDSAPRVSRRRSAASRRRRSRERHPAGRRCAVRTRARPRSWSAASRGALPTGSGRSASG